MLTESQNIEFKESWHDEYQKWICGFANAQGGILYIGLRDNGEVSGVQDAKKLMEDIPNKVRDIMGILVNVNLNEKDGKQYLEIVTEAYPYPISFRGKYYQRSGATNQELKGAALDRFMLRKQGKTWDGVPVPYLKVEDLDKATFDLFRKYAKRSGRMEEADLMDDNHGLLEKLRLYEGGYLKRAAALLFHPDPEQYVTGAFVKVGFFREGMDLVYQDEVHGNLFQQIETLMDLLCTKYMKAVITYEGIHRIETLPMPREALREALLNACINKDYAEHSPIQSIERIITACKNDGFSTPEFRYDVTGIWTTFKFEYPERATAQNSQKTIQKLTEQQQAILIYLNEHPNATRKELCEMIPDATMGGVIHNLARLQELGLLKRVGGRKQGYWQIIG